MKKDSINGAKRKLQVSQGAYDGRYRQKRVEDRKKLESKKACRGYHIEY